MQLYPAWAKRLDLGEKRSSDAEPLGRRGDMKLMQVGRTDVNDDECNDMFVLLMNQCQVWWTKL